MNKNVSDQVVYQAGNETTDTIKNMDISDEKSYKDFVDMYKGVVDMKCLQDYGTLDDKNLWQDCAKELYLKSASYLTNDKHTLKDLTLKKESKTMEEETFPKYKLFGDWNVKISRDKDDGHLIVTFIDMDVDKKVFPEGQTTYSYDLATLLGKDGLNISRPLRDMSQFRLDFDVPQWTIKGQTLRDISNWLDTFEKYIDTDKKTESVEKFKSGDVVDILSSYGKWLNSSDRIKYVIDRPATKEEIKGIWDIDTPCYIVKTIGMTDDTKFLNGTSKEPVTRLRSSKSIKTESVDDKTKLTYKYTEDGNYYYKDSKNNWYVDMGNHNIGEVALYSTTKETLEPDKKVDETNFILIDTPDKADLEYEHDYMLLGRLVSDCKYFLGNGNGYEGNLWAGSVEKQIKTMKALYNKLPKDKKPEWLTMDDINNYEKEMKEVLKMKSKTESYKDTEVTVGNIKELAHRLLNPEDIDTYKSDLYLKVSEKSTELINKLKNKNSGLLSKFRSPKDGNMWYDIPFANMQEYINTKNIKESTSIISGELKVGDKFKGRIDGSIFEITAIDPNKQKVTYKVNDKTFTTGINHFKHTLLDRIEDKPLVTESKIDNYTLSELRKVINSEGNDFTIKIINENVDVETKYLDIDKEDLRKIYIALAGNDNDLIKLPSEENSEDTRNFIQGQLDKSYDKKYESRPDKDAARSRMFSNSRKKLNMPDKFSSLDEIVSYLEKCDDQIDVMNVNTHVGNFNRQLHNDMLTFADKFIKENGYLDSYHDTDGKEHEGSFKKFKQEMINFVKNYKLQPKLQEDQYQNEKRKGRPNVKKIAEDEYYDNQDWYIQHIKDYKDEADFVEREKAEIASEYNLTETRSEMVCKEIYKLAKENKLI